MIEEIVQKQTQPETTEEEVRVWNLHEDLFKNSSQRAVNPEHLVKNSAQMFAVYKYYGDPSMLVKSKRYTNTDDFVAVKDLISHEKFFDAPAKHVEAQ